MAAGPSWKINAASARAHTRKPKPKSSASMFSGLLKKLLLVGLVGFLAWAYQATRPPPPKTCGSPNGPPITGPRVQLKDGRCLAYKEYGVPKENAKHEIVFVHGLGSSRHDASIFESLSPDTVTSKGIYVVSFDRPGYGESDPHPSRTTKSLALDIEQLADLLGLGSKFYVVGFSMGGEIVWTCLKYIPHRLAGTALLAPVINYWWSGIPSNISQQAYLQHSLQDQWAIRVAHHLPWLTYWWNTQRFFPGCSVIAVDMNNFSDQDKQLLPKLFASNMGYQGVPRQQGVHESLHRDLMVLFGRWEFSPLDLKNPFTDGGGSVHIWQGDEDRLVPVALQRYIASRLPWIHYHELAGAGHMFPYADGMVDKIIEALTG